MLKTIKQYIQYCRQLLHLLFDHTSFINQTGYLKSLKKGIPIDKDGNPTLWMNYSIIEFLDNRLGDYIKVFEWGSGYSTIFIADRVKEITTIENSLEWYNNLQHIFKDRSNIKLYHVPYGPGYIDKIDDVGDRNKYEIIIVDGFLRVDCAKKAIDYLSDNGVLIIDDSSRERYEDIFTFYKKKGFREITFSGLKPSNIQLNYTTIFYRTDNVLNI